jgi:hypothetical protein
MEESGVPDWVSTEEATEPPETVILEGSPSVTSQAPQQIFVQGHGGPGMIMPTTNAVLALVLGILGIVACSVCTALPALILANGALTTTSQYPGHPDQGLAKAAQIVAWIGIGLFILMMVVYGGLFTAMILSGA